MSDFNADGNLFRGIQWSTKGVQMIRLKMLISCILFSLILSGCTNKTDGAIYFVGIDEIKNVKVDEAFEITGYLQNNSKKALDISHGSAMFTYEIYGEDGVQILPSNTVLFRNDVGYTVTIDSYEEYRNNGEDQRSIEYYQFLITEPGVYKVKTNVEFSVLNEDKEDLINISSDWKQFIVE
ncbi:hypothetical protein ACFP56_10590 [Paenibacillus septentrionalis]|uniref:DUF4352 domain-containing protein n=1 Tax=Paenibacillus septentrionalis TaxID=429342 RepID=A0ABW1V2Q0_9BACL